MTWDIRNHKYKNSLIRIASIRKVSSLVAVFNNLENPEEYTGHSFRVSSTMALADAGVSLPNVKRHSGWKSDSVVEGYFCDSKKLKMDVAIVLSGFAMPDEKLTTSTTFIAPQQEETPAAFAGWIIHGNVTINNNHTL